MSHELIGDRFLLDRRFLPDGSTQWIDLATGGSAAVTVYTLHDDWSAIEHRLREEMHARTSGRRRLLDYGRVGLRAWFEARATAREAVPVVATARDKASAHEIGRIAEARTIGIRHVCAAAGSSSPALASTIARRLRATGFVTIRASVPLPAHLREELAHRHLALLYRSLEERQLVTSWIRHLARASHRAHVVVRLGQGRMAGTATDLAPAGWEPDVRSAVAAARALIASGQLIAAEALLSALDAEAVVYGTQPLPAIAMSWALLRQRQGRLEEAERCRADANTFGEITDVSASRHSRIAAARARRGRRSRGARTGLRMARTTRRSGSRRHGDRRLRPLDGEAGMDDG